MVRSFSNSTVDEKKKQFDIAFDLVHISQTGFLDSFYDDNDYNHHYKTTFFRASINWGGFACQMPSLRYTFTFVRFLYFLFFSTSGGNLLAVLDWVQGSMVPVAYFAETRRLGVYLATIRNHLC